MFTPEGHGTSYLERNGENEDIWSGEAKYFSFSNELRSTSKLKLTRVSENEFRFDRTRSWLSNKHTFSEWFKFERKEAEGEKGTEEEKSDSGVSDDG